MNGRRALLAAVMLGLSLAGLPLSAQPTFFKWVDAKGSLHVTDRLADVPEPYYGMYRARIRALEEQRTKTGQPAAARQPTLVPTPPVAGPQAESAASTPVSPVVLELQHQANWQALVARWRGELANATTDLESIQTELDEASMNPILRETPEVKSRIEQVEARRSQAMARLEKARKMLLDELPARARREGVPPKWLE
jgi:hypothetical protein